MTVSHPSPILRGGVSTSLSFDACIRNYVWASLLFLFHVFKTQQASGGRKHKLDVLLESFTPLMPNASLGDLSS